MLTTQQPDGNFFLLSSKPTSTSETKPIDWVHAALDAGHFVRALVTSKLAPPGTTLLASTSEVTKAEFSSLWTQVMHERKLLPGDKSLMHKDHMSVDEYIEVLNMGPFGREVAEAMIYVTEFGIEGGDPDVKRPSEVGVEVERLTSLEEYIRTADWSSVL